MTTWRYFFTTPQDIGEDSHVRALGRTDEEGPRHNAQVLGKDGTWSRWDFLERYHLLGSNDIDYVWVTVDRARSIVADKVAGGRVAQAPDEP